MSSNYLPVTMIYKNNGDGSFTPLDISLPGTYDGVVTWGDYDNDGDLDLFIAGSNSPNICICKLYQNNGNDLFVDDPSFSVSALAPVSADWGDYNCDGYLDLIVAGGSIEVYKNNANKTFTKQTGISIPEIYHTKAEWADFNSDGFLDFIYSLFLLSLTSLIHRERK